MSLSISKDLEHTVKHRMMHLMLKRVMAEYVKHGDGTRQDSATCILRWNRKQCNRPDHPDTVEEKRHGRHS